MRLQQFINARDEVEAGIARIEGIKIGRKKQELHVGIEMVKLLEGRTTRLYSRAAHDHARFHGTEKRGSIGQIARGFYFEAGAVERIQMIAPGNPYRAGSTCLSVDEANARGVRTFRLSSMTTS